MYTVGLGGLAFEWDPVRAAENRAEHGVTFNEASTAFLDEHARLIFDALHPSNGQWLVLIGMSGVLSLLVVCHDYLPDGETIHITAARRANESEQNEYTKHLP